MNNSIISTDLVLSEVYVSPAYETIQFSEIDDSVLITPFARCWGVPIDVWEKQSHPMGNCK